MAILCSWPSSANLALILSTSVREVDAQEVPSHVRHRILQLDIAASLADDDSQLEFMIDPVLSRDGEMDLLGRIVDGSPGLHEDNRELGDSFHPHFLDVLEVVLPDAEDLGEGFSCVGLVEGLHNNNNVVSSGYSIRGDI